MRQFCREAEQEPFKKAKVVDLVNETLSFCNEKFRSRGVHINVTVSKSLEIDCQPVQVSQVLLNLFNNAYDAIEVSQKADFVHISVSDSGQKIDSEVACKLFQPFFTTKDVGKGTGLGLSVSAGIAEAHGGSLEYNARAQNTQFILILAISQPEMSSSKAA